MAVRLSFQKSIKVVRSSRGFFCAASYLKPLQSITFAIIQTKELEHFLSILVLFWLSLF